MKKILFSLSIVFSLNSFSQNVITFCNNISEDELKMFLVKHDIELLSFLRLDNSIIYNGDIEMYEDICYNTTLRTYNGYLSFPKNEIIISQALKTQI